MGSLHPGSVAHSPDSNAEMFLNSNVARFPRWIVRCSTGNIVRRFPPRTAAPELSVSVPWFPAFVPRRSMSSNVPLSITRNVAQSPDRSVMMSTLLVKFAVTVPRRFVRTDPPPSQVRGRRGMFQWRRQEVCPRDQAGVHRRGGAGAQADLRAGMQNRIH